MGREHWLSLNPPSTSEVHPEKGEMSFKSGQEGGNTVRMRREREKDPFTKKPCSSQPEGGGG